jgi:predicted anti-sigma-YlaC factor YlaD
VSRSLVSEPTLSCREVTELVTDNLEGALTPATRVSFEEHMSSCEGCRIFAEQIEHTVAVLRMLPHEAGPAPSEHLLDAFRRRGQGDEK